MKRIEFKQLKRLVGFVAGAGLILSLYTTFRTDNPQVKSFSLFMATASALTGIGSFFVLLLAEGDSFNQLETITDNLKTLESDKKQLVLDNSKLSEEFRNLKNLHDNLIGDWNKTQTERKGLDNKIESTLNNAKIETRQYVDDVYNRLISSLRLHVAKVQKSELSEQTKTRRVKVLNKRWEELTVRYKNWSSWINDMKIDDCMSVSHQIFDEISSHKSKIIASSERLSFHQYIPKEYAKKEDFHRLKDEYFETMQTGVDKTQGELSEAIDLLQETGKYNELLSNQLQEKDAIVGKLVKPILFNPAPNHPTQAGNTIIEWCFDHGIHLDRSHYTGDLYEAEIFFYCDRLNPGQDVNIKALNEKGEFLAQKTHCLRPVKFHYDYDSRLLCAKLTMNNREKSTTGKKVSDFLQPVDRLIEFVNVSYHIGLWGSTGQGKTTAIANIIGGMVKELGAPKMRITIPKIDEDTASIFPECDWLGVSDSVFGLLEAALEIQFRIEKNKIAYQYKKPFPLFEPTIFFIDEINMIFDRWGRINDPDMENVLSRFEETLEGERKTFYQETFKTELENYKNEFAKRLLLFVWQTGRSLKIKSLIAGQNLQPGALKMLKNNLNNCSYIAFRDAGKDCMRYKVKEGEITRLEQQDSIIDRELETNPNLKYTGLFCPAIGKPFFGILPPPNYYQWNKPSTDGQESPIAHEILEYLKNSEIKTPKTIRAIKKSRRFANVSEGDLKQALDELLVSEKIEVGEDGSYQLI